jgi:hypothetical protein
VTSDEVASILYNTLRMLVDALDNEDALTIENALSEAKAVLYEF